MAQSELKAKSKAGRPKGSNNKSNGIFSTTQTRCVRLEIRITPAFRKFLNETRSHTKQSDADILHEAMQYYLLGRCWWLPAEQFKEVQQGF